MDSADNISLNDYGHSRTSSYAESGRSRVYIGSTIGEQEHEQVALPRADGGRQAWLFLAGSFMMEALIWGESSLSVQHLGFAAMAIIDLFRLSILVWYIPGILLYSSTIF